MIDTIVIFDCLIAIYEFTSCNVSKPFSLEVNVFTFLIISWPLVLLHYSI